jgi:predicted nucleic-acid-binding protein
MPRPVLVDSNVVLRFLLADDVRQSAEAVDLFTQAPAGSLQLSPWTLAEVTWVLLPHYQTPRDVVAAALQRVLALPSVSADAVLLDAVARFAAAFLDFADCVLASQSAASGVAAVTFDRDLRRFSDITALAPRAARQRLQRS